FGSKNAFGVNRNGAGNRRSQGGGERIQGTAPRGHDGNGDLVVGDYTPPVIANPGNVIRTGNGGNQLGHPLAHDNEAPMNLALAEPWAVGLGPPAALADKGASL